MAVRFHESRSQRRGAGVDDVGVGQCGSALLEAADGDDAVTGDGDGLGPRCALLHRDDGAGEQDKISHAVSLSPGGREELQSDAIGVTETDPRAIVCVDDPAVGYPERVEPLGPGLQFCA